MVYIGLGRRSQSTPAGAPRCTARSQTGSPPSDVKASSLSLAKQLRPA